MRRSAPARRHAAKLPFSFHILKFADSARPPGTFGLLTHCHLFTLDEGGASRPAELGFITPFSAAISSAIVVARKPKRDVDGGCHGG